MEFLWIVGKNLKNGEGSCCIVSTFVPFPILCIKYLSDKFYEYLQGHSSGITWPWWQWDSLNCSLLWFVRPEEWSKTLGSSQGLDNGEDRSGSDFLCCHIQNIQLSDWRQVFPKLQCVSVYTKGHGEFQPIAVIFRSPVSLS